MPSASKRIRKLPNVVKARYRWCWECGRKLWGKFFATIDVTFTLSTTPVTEFVHRACGEQMVREGRGANLNVDAWRATPSQPVVGDDKKGPTS